VGFEGLRGYRLGTTKDVEWKEAGAGGKQVWTVRELVRGIVSVEFEMKNEEGLSLFYRHMQTETPEIAKNRQNINSHKRNIFPPE